ncbi:vancomycin resistance histidine kinase VanS [Anaerocolumna sedimenticola]|uniref:histidine kinase n=1 Tax=Anaerocolumna sedimenticola TaxID=2696063 RepID=A0A6P1TTH7_9FIRM|nr:vancomycin resistance histidine kinase VanS [Anaerocolumna sedimenticola]QHQ63016.1 vancomycin resistance histidine kinase VanS [Anaerocolumna sedimenticola]
MINKKKKKNDYTKFEQKLSLYIFLIAVGTGVLISILMSLIAGKLGNAVVAFLQRQFFLDYEDAITIYQYSLRNNKTFIIALAGIIGFWIILRIFISVMTHYFDEISQGLDALMDQNDRDIILSPEMSFLQVRLNECKYILKQREQDAKLAEQRKNDLVVYLAHDIKTPLTSVIGYLSLLEEAPDMPAKQEERYVKIALDKAYRLEKLINEFFEITRYNLQNIVLEKEDIDLYYMLVQLADEFYPLLEPYGKKAVIHADENIVLYGDSEKLARVFNNILKNAITYSAENTVIHITAKLRDNEIIITFQNSGKTIPREKLNSIFEKFFRLDDARVTNTGGAGLGLAIAKEIVALHGGTIYAESENGTTTFTVTLPVNKEL